MNTVTTLIGGAILACSAAYGGATILGIAHADPITDAVNDPVQYEATCKVLKEQLTGQISNDVPIVIGVAKAQQTAVPGMTDVQAGGVIARQVKLYCPDTFDKVFAVAVYLNDTGDTTGKTPDTVSPTPAPATTTSDPQKLTYA